MGAGQPVFQPDFELLLLHRLQNPPNVTKHRGQELVGLEQGEDAISLEFAETGNPEARFRTQTRYVVGGDGARSTLRELLGIRHIDLGFAYDFLVLDCGAP